MLISLHIPKTAGTSWRIFVEQNAGLHASFVSAEERDADQVATHALSILQDGKPVRAQQRVNQAGITLIAGHQATEFLHLWPDAPVIGWLRHPVDRVISEFLHLKARPQPGEFAQRVLQGEVSLDAFAKAHDAYYAAIVKRLENRPGAYCFFVTELPAAAESACHAFAGWQGSLPRRNVTPPSHYETIPDLDEARERLSAVMSAEIAIYEHWRQAWKNGSVQPVAREVLAHAPDNAELELKQALRRRAGIAKERIGHWLGQDWR